MKYLFTAELADGTVYQQDASDVSKTDPLRSAYYDIRDADILRFTLTDTTCPSETASVDLVDGSFSIKGKRFFIHKDEDAQLKDFRLIYFRRNVHTRVIPTDERSHSVTFYIGWQATHNDKNYKRIIELN